MIEMINQQIYIVWAHALYKTNAGTSKSESQIIEVYGREEDAINCIKALVRMEREDLSKTYILKNYIDTEHYVDLYDKDSSMVRSFGYWVREVK